MEMNHSPLKIKIFLPVWEITKSLLCFQVLAVAIQLVTRDEKVFLILIHRY